MNVSMQARLVGNDRYLFVNTQRANLDGLEKPEGSSATLMLNVLLHNFQRRTSARASKV